jgi:uncharacterized protein YbjT (DUF2867 family)
MILMCGATGDLGGRVAARLLERGATVRALVRPTADASALAERGAEVVRGDFRDPGSLEDAVAGVETVVSGVTVILRMLSGSERRDGFRAVDRDGHFALIAAAERAGAKRFVFISAAGIEGARHTPLGKAKLAVEERLRRSPITEVIVRPDAFQEVWLGPAVQLDWPNGKLTIYGRGDASTPYVAMDDVAEAVVALTLVDDPPRFVEFGGPEALTRKEVADLIERAARRPMKRRHVPRAALAAGSRVMGPIKPELASVMGLSLNLDRGGRWDDGPLRDLGIVPRSASAYIAETVRA